MTIAKIFHTDHGVSNAMLQWAIDEIKPTGDFLKTLILPDHFPDLQNALYGPASGSDFYLVRYDALRERDKCFLDNRD